MKNYFIIFLVLLVALSACKTQNYTTTYYLIRHAEKDKTDVTNKNPNLNTKGQERAVRWSNYFKDIKLDAIYSTNYNRTLQTAKPTGNSKNIEITLYNPRDMYNDAFKKETKGKTVLIVGHSNTTPFFANKIINKDVFKQMDENDNSSLFVISFEKEMGFKKRTKIENRKVD